MSYQLGVEGVNIYRDHNKEDNDDKGERNDKDRNFEYHQRG